MHPKSSKPCDNNSKPSVVNGSAAATRTRRDEATVSVAVTSKIKQRPSMHHVMSLSPSGPLPSVMDNQNGSQLTGKEAEARH